MVGFVVKAQRIVVEYLRLDSGLPIITADFAQSLQAPSLRQQLAVFIKSEMLREVRENCFCKYQRYPIITIESQNKTIMTDKRHNNDVIINYNLTNILVTQLKRSLQFRHKLLL